LLLLTVAAVAPQFTVIIDNMMNLEILTYAALNVSDADCGGCR